MGVRTCDFLVVGAGIIGLATAFTLKRKHPSAAVVVLEKEAAPGLHASGRNSGVLHTGIYYPPGTLKARICADGAARMKAFAAEHELPCKVMGKVIVPVREEENAVIEKLVANARANGVRAEILDAARIKEIEPHTEPRRIGLYVPDTAAIDSGAVVRKIRDLLESAGTEIRFGEAVISADAPGNEVWTPAGRYAFGHLFNCAGAHADVVARLFGLGENYRLVPFKGIYWALRPERNHLVRGNIYRVPDVDLPFLGVHFSRGVHGGVHVGPSAIPALGRENYGVFSGLRPAEAGGLALRLGRMYLSGGRAFRRLVHDEVAKCRKARFIEEARRLVPSLGVTDLVRSAKVGIRPQLVDSETNRLVMDHVVEKTDRSTHVLNAISPAFTGAFAFADLLTEGI